ncbi:hypothetical protein F4814DRAFT_434910 [Daldinia grandis]|nr:hypothetical protein F4814DRAFT_434910 [Daldinia grandis]
MSSPSSPSFLLLADLLRSHCPIAIAQPLFYFLLSTFYFPRSQLGFIIQHNRSYLGYLCHVQLSRRSRDTALLGIMYENGSLRQKPQSICITVRKSAAKLARIVRPRCACALFTQFTRLRDREYLQLTLLGILHRTYGLVTGQDEPLVMMYNGRPRHGASYLFFLPVYVAMYVALWGSYCKYVSWYDVFVKVRYTRSISI